MAFPGRRAGQPGCDLVVPVSGRAPPAVCCCLVNDVDEVTTRFRALLGRRYFVDREAGVLLVWVPADAREVTPLLAQVEARHPATRIAVQESGAAVAVRITAQEQDLARLEDLYLVPDPA
jgi:hypothetical protein